jgi:hypothetical protein
MMMSFICSFFQKQLGYLNIYTHINSRQDRDRDRDKRQGAPSYDNKQWVEARDVLWNSCGGSIGRVERMGDQERGTAIVGLIEECV